MNCTSHNVKVTEGNAFALILPLKSRHYVAEQPIDEDIDITLLQNVVVKVGGVTWEDVSLAVEGVTIGIPSTQARGTYNVELTAVYNDINIRAAYFECFTIVAWSYQSDVQNYIPDSPIIAESAFFVAGNWTDAELEALKEEYREKNAQLDQAIADAEEAKREWEEKAADLDGVAQEETLTQGVQDIREDISHIDIDTSTLAKQGTNPNATLTEAQEKIGTPASGQSATLFGAIGDVALNTQTLQSLADSWAAMVTNRSRIEGYEIAGETIDYVGDLILRYNSITKIVDTRGTTLNAVPTSLQYGDYHNVSAVSSNFRGRTNLQYLYIGKLQVLDLANFVYLCSNLVELYLPELLSNVFVSNSNYFRDCPKLQKLSMPSLNVYNSTGNDYTGDTNLIDIEFGQINNSFSISSWSPTNALMGNSTSLLTQEDIDAGFTSNLQKLLYNIREHIAARIADRTGLSSLTITFSSAVKAAILADQPTADAFTSRGWTIA